MSGSRCLHLVRLPDPVGFPFPRRQILTGFRCSPAFPTPQVLLEPHSCLENGAGLGLKPNQSLIPGGAGRIPLSLRWDSVCPGGQEVTTLCFLFQQNPFKMDIEDCNGRSYISGRCRVGSFGILRGLGCSGSSFGIKSSCGSAQGHAAAIGVVPTSPCPWCSQTAMECVGMKGSSSSSNSRGRDSFCWTRLLRPGLE